MEAGDWKELDFLLRSAGVPIDEAIGLDSDDDESVPSPKTFKENLKFTVKGEEMEFPFPYIDLKEFKVYGTEELEDKLYTPPPFLDLERILQPNQFSAEDLEKMRKEVDAALDSIQQETERNEEDSISDASTPELPRKLARKRCRESEEKEDETVGIGSLAENVTVIPDDGSSRNSPEEDMDQDSVIDLTQQ